MQYFQITINNTFFNASLSENDDNWYEILVGGSRVKCVIIHVYPKDKYCSLISMYHDKECNLSNDLPNKIGTRDMIFAGIHLSKFAFPSLEYMSLQDESTIKCGGNIQLPLGDVQMLLYGQTWYQRHCGADPVDKTSVERVQKILKHKPHIPWDRLWDNYLSHGFKSNVKKNIQNKYESSQTWHEFFQSIQDDNCNTWSKWIGFFMKMITRGYNPINGSMWTIDMKKLQKNTVTIKQIDKPPKQLSRPTYTGRRLFGGQLGKRKVHR